MIFQNILQILRYCCNLHPIFHTDTRKGLQMNQMHYVELWFQIIGSNQDLNQHTEVFVQYFGSSSVPLERLMSFDLSLLDSPKTTCSLCANFILTLNRSINGLYSKNKYYFLPSSYAADFFHAQLCVLMNSTHQKFSSACWNNIWGPPGFSPLCPSSS